MTPEEQREVWLKRILPALGIMVIYFVFISGFISEKTEKAQSKYGSLARKGISSAAVPGMESQIVQLEKQLGEYKGKERELQAKLKSENSFLFSMDSTNTKIARISFLLARNQLQIVEEKRLQKFNEAKLPSSLRDANRWFKKVFSGQDYAMNLLEIHFTGGYLDTLKAMEVMAKDEYKVLPVSLSMKLVESGRASDEGKLNWVLRLWI